MEPILHLTIPILFLVAFFPDIKKDLIAKLSIFTIFPDLDLLFIPDMHRILLGNVFIVIIITVFIYSSMGKQAGYITAFFLGSHLLMDLGKPGTALFWPLYDKFIYVQSDLIRENSQWLPSFKIVAMTIAEKTSMIKAAPDHYYLATQGTLIIIVVIILIFALILANKTNKKTSKITNP